MPGGDDQESLILPPRPLNTLQLQLLAAKHLRMSPDRTMLAAQDLYAGGLISYHRTKENLSDEELKRIVDDQVGHPVWGDYADELSRSMTKMKRHASTQGVGPHTPIVPIKFTAGSEKNWRNEETKKLFQFINKYFLASLSKPASIKTFDAEMMFGATSFTSKGEKIITKGFLDIYNYENLAGSELPRYEQKQDCKTAPTFSVGSPIPMSPPHVTDSDLLSFMDRMGIGTPATVHTHIQGLIDNKLITRDRETMEIEPTALGVALICGYNSMEYKAWSRDLRDYMVQGMRAISSGERSKNDVLNETLDNLKVWFRRILKGQLEIVRGVRTFLRTFLSNETQLHDQDLKMYTTQLEEFKIAEREGLKKNSGVVNNFRLLDTTQMLWLRPDGHPSSYWQKKKRLASTMIVCIGVCLALLIL